MTNGEIVQKVILVHELTRSEIMKATGMTGPQVDGALTNLKRAGILGYNGVHPYRTYYAKTKELIQDTRGLSPISQANLDKSPKRPSRPPPVAPRFSGFRHPLDIAWQAFVNPMANKGGQD